MDEGPKSPQVRRGQRRLEDERSYLVISDWQREILRERLEDLERNPDDEQPWEEVEAELRTKKYPPPGKAP